MDVAAGITPAGKWTRLDENAPSFKMWLQRHPSISNLFINVLILERHLSKEFAEEIEASLEEARFAKYKTNNAFLRFVTDMPLGDRDLPHATFGHEATTAWESLGDVSPAERKLLAFTRWLYNCFDEGLQRAENALAKHLQESPNDAIPPDYVTLSEALSEARAETGEADEEDDSPGSSQSQVAAEEAADIEDPTGEGMDADAVAASADGVVDDSKAPIWNICEWWRAQWFRAGEFLFPKGCDFPTSLIWFISNSKTYGHHHDATKSNHDQQFQHQCAEQMRIASTCVAGSNDGTEVPEGYWGIRHGL